MNCKNCKKTVSKSLFFLNVPHCHGFFNYYLLKIDFINMAIVVGQSKKMTKIRKLKTFSVAPWHF